MLYLIQVHFYILDTVYTLLGHSQGQIQAQIENFGFCSKVVLLHQLIIGVDKQHYLIVVLLYRIVTLCAGFWHFITLALWHCRQQMNAEIEPDQGASGLVGWSWHIIRDQQANKARITDWTNISDSQEAYNFFTYLLLFLYQTRY